jgi:hypothetical protein
MPTSPLRQTFLWLFLAGLAASAACQWHPWPAAAATAAVALPSSVLLDLRRVRNGKGAASERRLDASNGG